MPTETIATAGRFARRLPAAHATTVTSALLDPSDGALAWCTASAPGTTAGPGAAVLSSTGPRPGPGGVSTIAG